ncbi:hypothetical protein QYM36_009595, partial [Artemia franciscana]
MADDGGSDTPDTSLKLSHEPSEEVENIMFAPESLSPLSGGYLLIVVAQPQQEDHKLEIINRLSK